ncbi:adenylyl-sulfate kinase [Roseicella sp. DB1501]|nr:adenylyl-sulfate kinase [Roseicella sp. DB1501]
MVQARTEGQASRMAGAILNFTGIGSAYEPPDAPDPVLQHLMLA